MPTEGQYIRALEQLAEQGLTPSWKKLLRSHWAAPGHTTSAALLARAVGYPNYGAANLNYGRLAARVGALVGLPPGSMPFNLYAVATWDQSERDPAGHFTFTMRPQLATALERLGWTRGAKAPQDYLDPRAFLEGDRRRLLTQHIRRERRLRNLKLQDAQRRSPGGRLRCEVPRCGFDFEAAYGALGHAYAEVHHLKSLASYGGEAHLIRLQDLAVICANCHAMVHRYGECRPLRGLVKRNVH